MSDNIIIELYKLSLNMNGWMVMHSIDIGVVMGSNGKTTTNGLWMAIKSA